LVANRIDNILISLPFDSLVAPFNLGCDPWHFQRLDYNALGDLRILFRQEFILVVSQQEYPIFDGFLQVDSSHLPLVLNVDILEVAQLMSYGVRVIHILILLLEEYLSVDGLQKGVLEDVVECADHLLQVCVNLFDVVLNVFEEVLLSEGVKYYLSIADIIFGFPR
jgi:hypothetical protein